jgi:hypothetical protein
MDIIGEGFENLGEWFRNHLNFFSKLILFLSPYTTAALALQSYIERGYVAFGGEYLFPVAAYAAAWFLARLADKEGRGEDVPTPRKRFTETDQYGGVNVEYARLQELILYMGDLEDWLERHGKL